MRRRSTVQFIPSRVTSVVERAMALVKESVTDRHQFHAGSDGIRGPGLVGLKTRWTHAPSAVKYFRPVAYLSTLSTAHPRPTSATDLVVRAMDQTLHVDSDATLR